MRHLHVQHNSKWPCPRCNQEFTRYDNYQMHERICIYKTGGKRLLDEDHPTSSKRHKSNISYVGGALKGTINEYSMDLESEDQTDIFGALRDAVMRVEPSIKQALRNKHALKFQVCLHAIFHLAMNNKIKTVPPAVLR